MPHFIAIKINYDHRGDLPPHLKYSRAATEEEHQECPAGFHECLNFRIPEQGNARVYLPTTCRPGIDRLNDEFVFFSFTYQQDPVLPSSIVGVHGRARYIGREGQPRPDAPDIPGIGRVHFSSGAEDGPNIYISSGQLDFLAAHKLSSSVVIVRFNAQGEVTNIQDLSFAELCKQFELIPIKYKLACRE